MRRFLYIFPAPLCSWARYIITWDMAESALIISTENGLYCPAGDFHIDAWRPVARNVVTHAHSDHARRGSARYLVPDDGVAILKKRLGADIAVDSMAYGQSTTLNGVNLSLHPAGHVLGSAQVRLEHRDEVWVFTGDYKIAADPTCAPFDLVTCNTFITECTFGLPLYRWRDSAVIAAEINAWWRQNIEHGRTSILLAYALGKAQRVLSMLDPGQGPILLHGAVHALTEIYRSAGVALPPAIYADPEAVKAHRGRAIVIAPPGAEGSPWIRKFHPESVAVASGWMQVRGQRRRQAVDRGFALSDHVDWPNLLATIKATGATHVIATHGYTGPLVRYLREGGLSAEEFPTQFTGESNEDAGET
jgi:putative mRNA 3-end processing factor